MRRLGHATLGILLLVSHASRAQEMRADSVTDVAARLQKVGRGDSARTILRKAAQAALHTETRLEYEVVIGASLVSEGNTLAGRREFQRVANEAKAIDAPNVRASAHLGLAMVAALNRQESDALANLQLWRSLQVETRPSGLIAPAIVFSVAAIRDSAVAEFNRMASSVVPGINPEQFVHGFRALLWARLNRCTDARREVEDAPSKDGLVIVVVRAICDSIDGDLAGARRLRDRALAPSETAEYQWAPIVARSLAHEIK